MSERERQKLGMNEQIVIGERLFILRNQNQMTQEELAEELNVSRQSISKWELNKALPDLERIIKISQLFQVSINYILFGTEEMIQEEKQLTEEKLAEISTDSQAEETLQSDQKGMTGNHYLLICIIIVGILMAGAWLCTGYFLLNNAWNKDNKKQTLVHVDKIYEQYTKADVVVIHDNYDQKRTVWLDVDGVRENDYVYGYTTDGDRLSIDYYPRTWLFPAGISIIFVILFILLFMELKKRK